MTNYNPQTTDNQSEMLIEVNEQDNIVGPVSRAECHNQTRKPWHRSTHVYLFNNLGEIYFSQRSFSKDTAPGQWTVSAGGHIRFGNGPMETAREELKEELGLEENIDFLDRFIIDYGSEREILYIYVCITSKSLTINHEEVEQVKTFRLDEIIREFENGSFKLSGGSSDSFKYLIKTGKLKEFWIKQSNDIKKLN